MTGRSRSEKPARRADVLVGPRRLPGFLDQPERAAGVVLFAHGSGSSRLSTRNNSVAGELNASGLATLLFDLLSVEEAEDRANVFDIPLLAGRLQEAAEWVASQPQCRGLPIGYFGASTGSAAALIAAASGAREIGAIVSRGGRPDLADPVLEKVKAPTRLIVGGHDYGVIELNQAAFARLRCTKALEIVPGATHLFEEPGALATVVALARGWFLRHLAAKTP
jgi:putative phosphoribosyl transferase